MKIENLYVGQVVKNYKELCSLLGEEQKKGDSRKYQIVDFERYFKYDKQGHKFIITEILEVPEEKKSRGSNNILPFIDEMEILIIHMLTNKEELIISNSKLLLELCMVNKYYRAFFNNKNKLAEILNMDIDYISDYYDMTNSTFKSAIDTVMKRLVNKRLIIHERVQMVIEVVTNVDTNLKGVPSASDLFEMNYETDKLIRKNIIPSEIVREATRQEKLQILKIERSILKQFECEDIQEVFLRGLIKEYYRTVNEYLFDKLNIKRSYSANKITIHKDGLIYELQNKLDKHGIKDIEELINVKVIERINDNSIKKHKKSFSSDKTKRFTKLRRSEQYIDNSKLLTDNLINIHKEKLDKKDVDVDLKAIEEALEGMFD